MEIIHVELPHKRREIPVPEVDGQNFLFKALNIMNSEVCAFLVPDNDI